MSSKIQTYHQERFAYVYLRQSTMNQVKKHQESTQRQYALKDKALALGWPPHLIKVLDADLGISGSQMNTREDFKTLIADVSLNKVGGVFALEASRLSRSCTDWHRLLELCSLTNTLILDEDGCYDPCDFNDQLVLGLKATMSYAESHFIRARLLGGQRNKAKKGELRFAMIPTGLVYDQEGKTILDPDEQIRSAVHLLFKVFREQGSAYSVARYFLKNNIQFPKRVHAGAWKGKVVWEPLSHARIISILKNPSYAGGYVFGRHKSMKQLSSDGKLKKRVKRLSMDAWDVLIHDHHEGYISWQEYLENQQLLANNNINKGETTLVSNAVREGSALLQGLLICGECGHRLSPLYGCKRNGNAYPAYLCDWKKKQSADKTCMYLSGPSLDEAISRRVLEVMRPAQLEIAIKAWEELERRESALDKQWMMKVERADYEAQLAQRSYEEVDPSNRLVAATLEKRWNDALENLGHLRQEYEAHQQKSVFNLATNQKQQILSLATDLPRLWKAKTTLSKDRKRILRLLINDITVEKKSEEKKVIMHIRWRGGELEDIEVAMPLKPYEKYQTPQEVIEMVRSLSSEYTDDQIIRLLNEKGIKSGKKKPFTCHSIHGIRFKHSIPSFRYLRKDNELTVKEVAQKFGVSQGVVYYWAKHSVVKKRQVKPGKGYPLWIIVDNEIEQKLKKWVQNSKRVPTAIEGGAL